MELGERIAYGVKGDAIRSFQCDLFLISLDIYDELIKPIRDTLQSLATGWLKLNVQWTRVTQHPLLPNLSEIELKCNNCKKEIKGGDDLFLCVQC